LNGTQPSERNVRERGIAFGDALRVFEDWTLEALDVREDYDEDRVIAIGLVNSVALVIVYTPRAEDLTTIISAPRPINVSAKRTGKHARSKKAKAKVAKSAPSHVVALDALEYRFGAVKAGSRTDWKRMREMPDEDIAAQIAADPDVAPVLGEDWFARAEVRAPRQTKVAISLRVDPDVLRWFKATGGQYQSHMNQVLRAYVEHQLHKTPRAKTR
jgi:uncharacterized protein (DUF4415 family)